MVYQRHIELWHLELNELIEACENATEHDQAQILAKLCSLIELAPAERAHFFAPRPKLESIQRMLACSAFVDAAISLVGSGSGFMFSKAPDGPALASVWTSDGTKEFHASGPTAAIAIVAAYTTLVFAMSGVEMN